MPWPAQLCLFRVPTILPASGGYVWLADCCQKHVSIYSGSIFAISLKENISATMVLKLIYHWSCMTTINNVENWVKVRQIYVATSYIMNKYKCVIKLILLQIFKQCSQYSVVTHP